MVETNICVLIPLRWVSTHSDGGHLVLPSLGKINAISGPRKAFMVRIVKDYPRSVENHFILSW